MHKGKLTRGQGRGASDVISTHGIRNIQGIRPANPWGLAENLGTDNVLYDILKSVTSGNRENPNKREIDHH